MASLNETFLDDLNDLDDDHSMSIEEESKSNNHMEEELEGVMEEFANKFRDPLEKTLPNLPEHGQVINLLDNEHFNKHLEKIEALIDKDIVAGKEPFDSESEEYQLIFISNEYISIIDREISYICKLIGDLYQDKFPELESLVINPLEYVKCVKKIKNEMDLNKIELDSILPKRTVVAVLLAASSTNGKPLVHDKLEKVLKACDAVEQLDYRKRRLLNYVESRMFLLAPNLSNVVGTGIAAQLIGTAGGIENLSRMPACNIQVLGSQKKNLLGFSKHGESGVKVHHGLFGTMEMVKNAPPGFQKQLVRMLSTTCALAVRADVSRTCPSGLIGSRLKAKMMKRFDKIQEMPKAKTKKPLPVPDDKPRRKRGGKKYRNLRAKLEMTEVRKYQNRLNFGPEGEDEYRETGKGYGMLGTPGAGKLKLQIKNNKISLSKKKKRELSRNMGGDFGSETGGLTSSIALGPTQGIALVNPDLIKEMKAKKDTPNYFDKESGFKAVIQLKLS